MSARPARPTTGALITLVAGACLLVSSTRAAAPAEGSWDPKAAAAYLDGRAAWWMTWPNASRDHGTFCVSCHTALPYALARPALRAALGELEPTPTEGKLLENVMKRVTLWKDVAPFYPDQLRGIPKTSESRGTEAILNALILATRDRQSDRLTEETRVALANMWALQMRTDELAGAWAWLNFHYEPWESPGAPYFGAALAALAVTTAPDGYASRPDIRENLNLLRGYFEREFDRQPLFNRLMVLWASTKMTDLLAPAPRASVIDAAFSTQRDDGGWSMASLGSWKRIDGSALDTRSDGYATGLVTLVLQQTGLSRQDPHIARGLEWLRRNQDHVTGQWQAWSLNKERDPASDAGRFMNDAASAFAVLALTYAR